MAKTEPREEELQGPRSVEDEEDRSTRRLLVGLVWALGVVALALLIVLFWLIRPESHGSAAQEAGYPIDVVTTIYGYGQGPDQLIRSPLGVAFDRTGNVWISNSGQARVEEYTSDGRYIRSLGDRAGAGKLLAPYGLFVDDERGQVYVADYADRLVEVYTTDGNYVGHLPADDQRLKVFGPNGFSPYAVSMIDGRVVVSSNDGLYFFDDSGHVVARWGGRFHGKPVRGSGWGQFNFPDSIDVDPATGRIYVADSMNRRIVALDREGRWLWTSGLPDAGGKIKGFWQLPRGIQVGPDGNLYVVDTFRPDEEGMGTGYLVVLSPDGRLLSEFGRTGSDDGAFNFPEQLASGPDGLWAIADRENHRVVVFRLRTPYPETEDLRQHRYPRGVAKPPEVFATPTPQPIG